MNVISKILLAILGFIIPPVAVLITDGCGVMLLINILLLFLTLWIGAVIHSWFLIFRKE
jgi:uncharacterized membrane protein YqaE (UPF0057 family)